MCKNAAAAAAASVAWYGTHASYVSACVCRREYSTIPLHNGERSDFQLKRTRQREERQRRLCLPLLQLLVPVDAHLPSLFGSVVVSQPGEPALRQTWRWRSIALRHEKTKGSECGLIQLYKHR